MEDEVLLDGALAHARDVTLATMPSALFFGAGLFETMRVEDGEPLFLDRHLRRLTASLAALPSVAPPPAPLLEADVVRRGVRELLHGRGTPARMVVKLLVADGHTLLTARAAPPEGREARIQHTEPAGFAHGATLPQHKTVSYLRSYGKMHEDVVFAAGDGHLCETPTANLFVLREGVLVTPPASSPCLPGIARGVLLEEGAVADLAVLEAPVHRRDLETATAAFVTNAVAHALPVVEVFGRSLGTSASLAAAARDVLAARAAREAPARVA